MSPAHEIKSLLIPEVEPEDDERNAVIEGEKEFKAGNYIEWSALKSRETLHVR